MPNWKWKLWGAIASALIAIYLLVPSLLNFREKSDQAVSHGETAPTYTQFFMKKGVNLGLDLRGGLYVELDVDLKEALKNRVDVILSQIEKLAPPEKFPDLKLEHLPNPAQVQVHLSSAKREEFMNVVHENFGDVFQPTSSEPDSFLLEVTPAYINNLHQMTLKQAVEAVRNRVDRYGVAEASIQLQGQDRIIVEIPGVKDPDRVINIIRKTGLLEFKLVDDSVSESDLNNWVRDVRAQNKIPDGYTKEIVDQLNTALAAKIPAADEILFEVERDPVTKEVINGVPYLVTKRSDVTGDMLRNAQVGINNNEPHVSFSLNKIGTKSFGDLTKDNVGKRLAIVLDGIVDKAPQIKSPILDGEGQITLGYGNYQSLLNEAEDLALLLREGALPASLTVATRTVIGPSLGADSIHKGLLSMALAAVVIILFMGFYYKLGGLVANIALILNVLLIFAILTLLQASLSLPGIAGIVLTMGMAVDANVIIFERMKEEIRLGKTAKIVIENGYSHAMSAIIDSNLTTLIAGVVLYQFGTGPIKGFATTLMIGILTTMYTAVVVTRGVYDYYLYSRKINKVII